MAHSHTHYPHFFEVLVDWEQAHKQLFYMIVTVLTIALIMMLVYKIVALSSAGTLERDPFRYDYWDPYFLT